LIVTSEAPPVVSGIAKTVELLQRGLTQQGHVVDVVSREDYPRYMRGEMRFSAFAFYWPSLRKQVKAYDVVNLHGPVPTISEVFLLLAQTLHPTRRPAIVYTHHSDLSISSLERLCSLYNTIAGRMAHKADAIVVSSNAYYEKLGRPAGKPVSVIPWAIDSGVGPLQLENRPRSGGNLRVLFVGQLRSYKGLHVLLDAVSGLNNVTVTVVGDGPLRRELQTRISDPALRNVTLAGRLPDPELMDAYLGNDVIVLPSTTTAEAYGLVLAEGMAAGCVPVASALPGVVELAAETGLVAPPGDSAALRAALLTLAGDRVLLRRLSKASLARSRRLSVGAMASQYEQVFRTAVENTTLLRAADAVPAEWGSPSELLQQLSEVIGVRHASLSLVSRTSQQPRAQVWTATASLVKQAPEARFVANLNRPVLLAPGMPWDPQLRPLRRRPGRTSSIWLPMHWTRRGVSIVELWTTAEDDNVLGRAELSKALRIVGPSRNRATGGPRVVDGTIAEPAARRRRMVS
jgi:rhamnosyl/mannosyltransferase